MKPLSHRFGWLLALAFLTSSVFATENYSIALIPKGATHEHWKTVHAGAVKAQRELAEKSVNVELFWKGPLREDDRDQQMQVVENFVAKKVSGIRVRLQKVFIYTLAGLFFGLAGLMQLSRLTQGDPTVAAGLELDIIAAVVIGGASLSGGTGSILGSMIGALIMAVLRNGSNQMGWPTYMQEIIIGAVIILAVGLDKLRQSRNT